MRRRQGRTDQVVFLPEVLGGAECRLLLRRTLELCRPERHSGVTGASLESAAIGALLSARCYRRYSLMYACLARFPHPAPRTTLSTEPKRPKVSLIASSDSRFSCDVPFTFAAVTEGTPGSSAWDARPLPPAEEWRRDRTA